MSVRGLEAENLSAIASADYMISDYTLPRNQFLTKQLTGTLNPLDKREWYLADTAGKLIVLLTFPVTFFIRLFTPVVDYGIVNHGWSKLLNTLQIILLPLIIYCTECKYLLFFI